ncbi:hypothetical protein NQ314_001300 [Rhamnusium bicolor]|uniref:DDE Tnp4 domain-containing protein n=1 Tax=Rhamnusium bicolor TaxID=1586634 RepID=A0AAV8ZS96_9CUCU|nr:hypothetical protein NQ314_001300 [Rhamnusium bicolor]
MKRCDPEQFLRYTRMTVPVFEKLLSLMKDRLSRRLRSDGIGAEERLAITLHIVLMAACDVNYLFTLVDIGSYGSQSDVGIFRQSVFGERLENRTMNVPNSTKIPNTNVEMPYVFVGDEAFPLKHYIMRPYPGKNLTLTQKNFLLWTFTCPAND